MPQARPPCSQIHDIAAFSAETGATGGYSAAMLQRSPFPVLVFDFDGTLIDSAGEIAGGVNALLAELGRPSLSLDSVRGFIGDGAAKLIERACAATGGPVPDLAATTSRYLELYEAMAGDPDQLYPDVRDTLARLQASGHLLGLCTNKPERATRKLLGLLGLDGMFGAVVGGDTLAQRKPDPAPVRHVLATLGGGAGVMIGDNHNDVASGHAAGLPVIILSYGYPRMPPDQLGAELVIDRFVDLPDALAELARRAEVAVAP
jgi:phosphoglycolate phosphatase